MCPMTPTTKSAPNLSGALFATTIKRHMRIKNKIKIAEVREYDCAEMSLQVSGFISSVNDFNEIQAVVGMKTITAEFRS